tara:strand:+ start:878 stop:1165 length:288 start_codon:yes stop_codon:yes gene_type:complete
MSALQINEEKAGKLNEVEDLSLGIVKEALNGVIDADDDQVKVATKMLSMVAKNRQTMTNRSAIEFGMATSIATDKELKKYVHATNPQIQKALMGN